MGLAAFDVVRLDVVIGNLHGVDVVFMDHSGDEINRHSTSEVGVCWLATTNSYRRSIVVQCCVVLCCVVMMFVVIVLLCCCVLCVVCCVLCVVCCVLCVCVC